MRREGGFALIAVLLVLALLAALGAEFAYSMRMEASALRVWRDEITAAHLAEAAVEQATREIAGDSAYVAIGEDGLLNFYTKDKAQLPRLPRTRVPFGPGEFSYVLSDEQGRINVNMAPNTRLDKLLQCMGVDKVVRDKIIDSILDWIDSNEEHRTNGAESDDHYLLLPTPYRARNAPLESLRELLQINGITPELYNGAEGKLGLADVLTVRAPGNVNVNTAGPVVLCGMNVGDAVAAEVLQTRLTNGLYTSVPGQLGAQGFGFLTTTFRVEARGYVGGRLRARVTAIVQKGATAGAPFRIVEWSGIQ